MMMNNGKGSMVTGNIWVVISATMEASRPLNLNREKAYPAVAAKLTAKMVTEIETTKLLNIQRKNGCWVNKFT